MNYLKWKPMIKGANFEVFMRSENEDNLHVERPMLAVPKTSPYLHEWAHEEPEVYSA